MEKIYETIIIGGGVGGLMAGSILNNALILEAKKNIGEKPIKTGEGISYRALKMIGIEPDSKWISCKINSILRVAPNGKSFGSYKEDPYAYIIDRLEFEKFLESRLKAKVNADTIVTDIERENDYWIIKTNTGNVYKSRFVIAADGANSVVRRKIFKEEFKSIPGYQYLVKFEKKIATNIAKIYLDNEKYSQGYAWMFPKSENEANVGICCDKNIKESFDYFLKNTINPEYGNCELIENRSGVIPRSGVCSEIYKDGAFLIGDAAGFTDPIFKGGMSQALLSGKIASECILKKEPEAYEQKIKSLPFTDPRLVIACQKLYSINNQALNELAEILENRGGGELKSLKTILKCLTKKNLRKDFFKVLYFFYIWEKNKDYLW